MNEEKTIVENKTVNNTIEVDPPKAKKELVIRINRNSILTILILILIVISGLQAVQLMLLRNKILSGVLKPVSASTSTATSSASSETQNLPNMAGGC